METSGRWRSVHRQAEFNRLRKKTREHEFVGRLEREFWRSHPFGGVFTARKR